MSFRSASVVAASKSSKNSSETACDRNNCALSFDFQAVCYSAVFAVVGVVRFSPSYIYICIF